MIKMVQLTVLLIAASTWPLMARAAGVSNLAESSPGCNWLIDSGGGIAESFTTAGSAVPLASVQIDIGYVLTSGGDFSVSIWSDSSGIPGANLVTLNGPADPVVGLNTYSPASDFNLSANTTYWVVAQVSGSGGYRWACTPSTNQSGDWTIGDQMAYTSGATWGLDTGPMRMSVQGPAAQPTFHGVPTLSEAGRYAMVLALLLTGAVYLRRAKA